MFSKNSLYSCIVAIALTTPVLAFAQDDQIRSVQVRVDDLNLNSESGKAVLTARVEQATGKLCGTMAQQRDLIVREQVANCRSEALASAQAQMQKAIAAAGENAKIAITLNTDR